MFKIIYLILFLILSVNAELSVAHIFQDSMVLQRDMAIPLWGRASANSKVSINVNGQEFNGFADEKGN